jgi:hypothetical protein
MRYVVRITFFGNARRPAIKDIAAFYHKKDAVEFEQKLIAEIGDAPHFTDFVGIDALSIEASSGLKIYQTKFIPYDERKKLAE